MDVYLPIANLSVNGLVIVALGAITGVLSGMFGVGGGFLTTPLLIFYGIPPTVAAASAASQVTGASVSGVFAYTKRNGVDYHMGLVMMSGVTPHVPAAVAPPTRPNAVITSSKISRMPCRSQIARSRSR